MNALYECVTTHVRAEPVRHRFTQRGYLWLVDLDDLPRHGLLASFDANARTDLEKFLAAQGLELGGGRILMLAHAKVFGHVFNPLTVYWCHDASGERVCVVAEVHNTYGGVHRYLLKPDACGRAEVAKAFYVSPFHPVDGHYRLSLPEPDTRLGLTVVLHRPGVRPFVARVSGRRLPASRAVLARLFLRYPLVPLAGSVRIRLEGMRLWLRGLRVTPRPRQEFR